MPEARSRGVRCCAGPRGGGGSSDPTGATYERVEGDPDPRLRPGHVCADVVRGTALARPVAWLPPCGHSREVLSFSRRDTIQLRRLGPCWRGILSSCTVLGNV